MPSFKQMDLDAYSAAHREEWNRLAVLAAKRRFTGAESDELIERYQAGATELSAMSTSVGQSIQGDRLSLSLSRARLRFTGASSNSVSQLPRFFAYQLQFKPALDAKNDPMLLAAVEGAISTGHLQGVELANLHRVAAKLRAQSNSYDAASAHVDQAIGTVLDGGEPALGLDVRHRHRPLAV